MPHTEWIYCRARRDLYHTSDLRPSTVTHRSRIAQVPGGIFSTLVTTYHQNERQSCPNISEMWTIPLEVRNDPGFKELERWRLWNACVQAKAVSQLPDHRGSRGGSLDSYLTMKLITHFLVVFFLMGSFNIQIVCYLQHLLSNRPGMLLINSIASCYSQFYWNQFDHWVVENQTQTTLLS